MIEEKARAAAGNCAASMSCNKHKYSNQELVSRILKNKMQMKKSKNVTYRQCLLRGCSSIMQSVERVGYPKSSLLLTRGEVPKEAKFAHSPSIMRSKRGELANLLMQYLN